MEVRADGCPLAYSSFHPSVATLRLMTRKDVMRLNKSEAWSPVWPLSVDRVEAKLPLLRSPYEDFLCSPQS